MADYDKEDGVWRTVGGRRIFIRNGQSLSDAMKESGKFKKKDEAENKPKTNRIPRDYDKITYTQKIESSAGKVGDKFELSKDEYGQTITKNLRTGETYQANMSMLRSSEAVEINDIIKNNKEYKRKIETDYALNFGDSSDNYRDTKDVPFSEKEKAVQAIYDVEGKFYTRKDGTKEYTGDISDLKGKHIAEKEVPDAYKDSMITSRNDDEVIKDLNQRKEQLFNRKDRYTPEEYKKQEDGLNAGIDYAKTRQAKAKEQQLSDIQKQAGARLSQKAENGVREDVKTFLSGKEDYNGSREDFINDLSNEWGVERNKVEDILHEENLKHPRNFKTDRPKTPHELGQLNETDEKIDLDKKSGFTQQTDMYGGTYEYSKEQLDKMKEHGTKPMEHSYTGGGWEGTKYDSKLSTKEIAKNINDYAKKEFPDVKISRKTDYNGIDIHVMSSDKDMYASTSDIDKMSDRQVSDTIRDSIGGYTRMDDWLNENNRKSANGTYTVKDERDYLKEQLNTYKNRTENNVSGNEWYLSDYGKKVISGLNKEMNSYNYDDSDGMVDYFDTNFYGYVHIGKWDKPYTANANPKTNKASSLSGSELKSQYLKYRLEHPNTKMTYNEFKNQQK